MKKYLPILLLILLFSCAGSYKQASHTSSLVYIGMPIDDFTKMVGRKAKIEAMEEGYTVYRMNDYDVWTGAIIDTKFYYFTNYKLAKIDGGQFKQQRYQVEVVNH